MTTGSQGAGTPTAGGLSVYQADYLAPTFHVMARYLYRPMLEASLAHVRMLGDRGLIDEATTDSLLGGLLHLWRAPDDALCYDGSVEDVYFLIEQRLASAAGVPTQRLSLQLARSRNDLDAAVFRMVLRGQLLDLVEVLTRCGRRLAEQARRHAETVIIGYTHRRPAQPTSLGHALVGYADALAGEVDEAVEVLRLLNRSPLGGCAFAGTDLDIDPEQVARELGFDAVLPNSYEAIAGADHLVRVAALHARMTATGARFCRTLLDWMTLGWIETPDEFCQGSSIMPQKRNPVVLEHMVSMAGATAADLHATLANVGAAWYEDSDNATTDVQPYLWAQHDRTLRFFTMMDRLVEVLTVGRTPTSEQIIDAGAMTTAVADALACAGLPFRGAHHIVANLARAAKPTEWTPDLVREAADAAGLGDVVAGLDVAALLRRANDPRRVLDRPYPGGPGRETVRAQATTVAGRFEAAEREARRLRSRLAEAHERLLAEVARRVSR